MLTREDCEKIIGYIEAGNITGLNKFVREEYEKVYYRESLKVLERYNKDYYPPCGYRLLPNNQLLLSTSNSFFVLNKQDLFTIYQGSQCEPLRLIGEDPAKHYLNLINADEKDFSKVTSKEEEKNAKGEYIFRIKSETDTIGQCFKADTINFAETILGFNVNYSLENNQKNLSALSAVS